MGHRRRHDGLEPRDRLQRLSGGPTAFRTPLDGSGAGACGSSAETVTPGETATFSYFVEVPDDPGSGTFGPVEVSNDGREWDTVGGTTDSNLEAGVNV